MRSLCFLDAELVRGRSVPDQAASGKPSKTRAAASFATGLALFGTGGLGGLARDRAEAPTPTPEQKRRTMWGGLVVYALAIVGGFIGADLARYPAIGVFLGVMAGLAAAGMLLLMWSGAAALLRRLRA